jgi:hypothetical protein
MNKKKKTAFSSTEKIRAIKQKNHLPKIKAIKQKNYLRAIKQKNYLRAIKQKNYLPKKPFSSITDKGNMKTRENTVP